MLGRMRVVLILSLALVLLISESFAAPSLVEAPEVAETPQADGETKSTDDKEDLQLQLAGKSDDDDDESEINHEEVAKEFGLTGTDLEQLYNTWVPTVPDGEDSSFQTFLDWMEENDEPEDEGVVGPGTHYLKSIIKWTGKILNRANKKAKGQRSIDEGKPDMEKSKIAAEFGLTEAELEDLYKLWVPKVPAEGDSSFQAFVDWMKENDKSDDNGAPSVGTHYWRSIIKWTGRIAKAIISVRKKPPPRPIIIYKPKPIIIYRPRPRPRSIEEEQTEMDRNQIAAEFGLTEADVEDLYQLWTQKTPAGEDASFQAFVQWMKDNYEPVDDGAVRPGTQSWSKFVKWGSGGNWFRKKSKKENIADEQQLTEVQRSVDDEQSEINEEEIATPDKRQLRGRPLRKKLPPIRRPRPRPRGLDEDQQPQSIVNGEESMAARDLQPSFKPAPKSPRNEEAELPKENAEDESLGLNADDFELDETELEKLYLSWVSTVPAGDDSSFPAFINWMKESYEPEDVGDLKIRTRFFSPAFIKFLSIANVFRKVAKKRPRSIEEVQMDGNQIAAGNEDAGPSKENVENESDQLGVVATEFGLTEAELKDLYEMWSTKVPAGEDSSFQAFFKWMDENDEPEDEGAVGPETHFRRAIKWTRRVIKWIEKKTKRDVGDEQQIAEVQRSIDEEQPQINQQEIATPDKRNFAAWWKKFGKMFQRKKPRSLEEDQQQSIVNGNEDAELPKENVEDESLGVNAAAYSGQKLFDAYRKWLKTVGEGKDRTFQKFADLFNIRKPRSLESELSDESKLPDKEIPEGEEKEKEVPAEESKPNDTNGGYSCEKNSPCNIENIVNEQFYFATTSTDKFIQCDAWGGCHTLTCDDGLVWDDQIKTCGLRT